MKRRVNVHFLISFENKYIILPLQLKNMYHEKPNLPNYLSI